MFQSPITHPANIVLAQNVLQCEPVSLYTMWSCVAVHNVQLCRCIQCEAVSLYTMCSCVAVHNVQLCHCTQCAAVSLYTMWSCVPVHNVKLCCCTQCAAVSLCTMCSCVAVHNAQNVSLALDSSTYRWRHYDLSQCFELLTQWHSHIAGDLNLWNRYYWKSHSRRKGDSGRL